MQPLPKKSPTDTHMVRTGIIIELDDRNRPGWAIAGRGQAGSLTLKQSCTVNSIDVKNIAVTIKAMGMRTAIIN